MSGTPRLVEVRKNVLKHNDEVARALRQRFADAGVFVVSLVSSPGTGKTRLLENLLGAIGERHRVAALVGDLATENDAVRLARSGAPVKQIVTGTVCHLDASMVERALEGWDLAALDFLFVENVGNLVCPSSYDLGENLRLVLLSVTEGEDKPLKYPVMFRSVDVVLLNKIDLIPHLDADVEHYVAHVREVNPRATILPVSARTGDGMAAWFAWLRRFAAAN